jgi:hypothetical protein
MLLPLLPGPVLAALVVAPLTWQQLQNASNALVQVANWDLVLGSVTLKNLLLIPVKLVIGRISWDPQWFYLLSAGVLTAAVWYLAWRGSRHYNRMRVYLIVPITLGIMVSFWFPMLQYFRFLFLAVPMSVAIGYGVAHNRWLRNGMIGLFLILSLIYLTFSTFHREDWKHLLISVPIEKPVYMIWEASDPVQYYYSDHPIIDLRRLEPGTDLSVLDPTINRPGVVGTTLVVVPYAAAIHGVAYQDYLDERGYALIEQEDFNGVPLQFWERQSP